MMHVAHGQDADDCDRRTHAFDGFRHAIAQAL
jgi:hypothetical protein